MSLLYNLGVQLYFFLIRIISLFHSRARSFVKGRRHIFHLLSTSDLEGKWVWFHMASAGEFEQARPVIERLRASYPRLKVLLTFYSPSGLKFAKHYPHADLISYLPTDTPANAGRFINSFDLVLVCFVKNEFWLNYLKELNRKSIPVISFSSTFRKNQLFFKGYGTFYQSFLFRFDQILVQDKTSQNLLNKIGFKKTQVCGDTRFDRVLDVARIKGQLPMINEFKGRSQLLVVGSAWPSDMKVVGPALKRLRELNVKLVIAPHQIDEGSIESIVNGTDLSIIRYTGITKTANLKEFDILLIDAMGLLTAIYGYADFAFVGGAFRGALHNTLEATVYGIPIFFGKHKSNTKFNEVSGLLTIGAAFEVGTTEEFLSKIRDLISNNKLRIRPGESGRNYVSQNGGATNSILNAMNEYLSPYK